MNRKQIKYHYKYLAFKKMLREVIRVTGYRDKSAIARCRKQAVEEVSDIYNIDVSEILNEINSDE